MGDKLKQALGGAVVIALVIGFKVYGHERTEGEARQALVENCAGDPACVQAVETHFETCFGKAYDAGGRRRRASFDAEEMVQCINSSSGVEWFVYDASAE